MKKSIVLALLLAAVFGQAQVGQVESLDNWVMGHAAGLSEGDDVVICGGNNGSDYLKDTWFYDRSEDDWYEVDDMNEVRYGHQAFSLSDYHVFVCGGWNGSDVTHNSSEIYNWIFQTWEEGPDMSVGRSNHRLTELADGRVLITGGFNGDQNVASCDIYDPETNSIAATNPMNNGRSGHTATLLNDDRVLVAGGFNPDLGFQMNHCEIYDPSDETWTVVGNLSQIRDNHAALLRPDGRVLVTGGRQYSSELNLFIGLTGCELFDPETETWSAFADLGYPQSYHSMFAYQDHSLVVGGTNHSGNLVTTTFSQSTWYDEEAELWWTPLEILSGGRYLSASVQLANGSVFVCGGENDPSAVIYEIPTEGLFEEELTFSQAYPNPFSESLFLDLSDNERVEIFNALGELIFSEINADYNLRINTSNWVPGPYAVQISSAGKQVSQVLIHQ